MFFSVEFERFRYFFVLDSFREILESNKCEKFNADGSLTGRTNHDKSSGKNNVRNCDLLQRDFFAQCRTVLGVKGIFLACVVKLGKR